MALEVIKQFNWVDILLVILLIRICYISFKNGLSVELFKLLGTIAAIYLALHYYTALSDWVMMSLAVVKEKMPIDFLDFLSCFFIAAVGYLIFVELRIFFYRFINIEAAPRLNHWGGLLLGIGRGVLLVGLIMYLLAISSITYLNRSVRNAYYGSRFFKVAPKMYSSMWNGFFSKFMTKEEFNKTVTEVKESFAAEK